MPSAAKAKKAAAKKAGRSKPGAGEPEQPAATAAAAAADGAGRPDPQIQAGIQLRFPPSLTARQRAAVHAVGERWGLPHSSRGEGSARHITLGPADAGRTIDCSLPAAAEGRGGGPGGGSSDANGGSSGNSGGNGPTDAQLIALIQQHLGIDASDAFAAGLPTGAAAAAAARPPAAWRGGSKAGKAQPGAKGLISVEEFIAKVLPLLEMEREAEVAQAEEALAAGSPESAAAKGRALLNLRLTDAEGGLLGRTLLTLVNNKGGGTEPLPPHKMSPHDIVRLRPSKGDASGPPLAEGVVYRVRDNAITVAVDEVPDEGLDVPLRLEKMANQVTYQRLRAALTSLGGEGQRGLAAPLVDVLFGRRAPGFASTPPTWQPLNCGLDESQQRAVSLALAARDVALIHGPPGTGKTTAVIEVICQEVARGNRVLACAASNVAVDNLVERLAAADGKMPLVRVGHPARLLPQVLDSSLEARVLESDNSALAKDCRKEMKALNTRLLKLVNRKDRDERRAVRSELRQLAKEERKRQEKAVEEVLSGAQEKAVEEVLSGAQVVCTTLTGVGQRQLERLQFDVVVIDEAAQALEPACWAALLKGRKAVLAGDHLQLPPTVISQAAARSGLSRTLFERLQDLWGEAASEMLTVQYRMNSAIMDWSSQELYGGRLSAHASVAQHTMAGVPGAGAAAAELPVLLLIDSAGCDMEEQAEEEGDSKWNDGEAKVVMEHVQRLMAAGISPADIGIITPYNAQVARLRELRPEALSSRLEISTVDGFQGREKEAIIISMVRSNPQKQVGFLADERRMNVAVTRARRHCALVADSDTVTADPFLQRLIAYFEAHGEYASAGEYVQQ
ncbi:DNA-binding SMUBP-2 isoform B [Chlorella sorokiniana]|uniref:DNA helicase n=1 Tax=Chlorella sorokiniana TaxID=3076 RepID=A0A2P6TIM0_CHLSO|nr:DNA-binding SMUBP-2 isoform B [Chlorella sorokiniana]|eukprot:PRW39069.1 DNA-binding SMUBP-2 isoform B [Chlorella sorokiniana]